MNSKVDINIPEINRKAVVPTTSSTDDEISDPACYVEWKNWKAKNFGKFNLTEEQYFSSEIKKLLILKKFPEFWRSGLEMAISSDGLVNLFRNDMA